jgi:sialate O-acetylesterase
MRNVFMATAIDLVDNYEIPNLPRYKEEVGKRLSLGAFNIGYQIPVEYSAPRVTNIIHRVGANDSSITVRFGPVSRLKFSFSLKNNRENGFELCCDKSECLEDQINNWQPLSFTSYNLDDASLKFEYSPVDCKQPLYVRYLWRQKPCEYKQCPWYSVNPELPVLPFIKEIVKYDESD